MVKPAAGSNPALGRCRSKKKRTPLIGVRLEINGGQGWIRTSVLRREQIYSLSPLTTRPPTLWMLPRLWGVGPARECGAPTAPPRAPRRSPGPCPPRAAPRARPGPSRRPGRAPRAGTQGSRRAQQRRSGALTQLQGLAPEVSCYPHLPAPSPSLDLLGNAGLEKVKVSPRGF